jgi:hypothetical protein
MDSSRFDVLTRSLGTGGTRRGVLQLIAGTGVGAVLLGQIGIEGASAKCVAPGKKCKSKNGKKKCCGGAKCQGKKCACPDSAIACGKTCCQPGQICLGDDTCANGPLEPGDHCDPDAPLACETGNCQCIPFEDGQICTCRQETCFGFGVPCTNTVQCCTGGCEGFTETCLPIEP